MIKFFRKIRQNLLSEGKTGKYMKYAIGEIVLVVIGILIALQINNLNQKSQEKKQLTASLKLMQLNLIENIKKLDEQIAYNESVEKEIDNFFKIVSNSNYINNISYREIDNIQLEKDFNVVQTAFKTMEAGSHFKWINNNALKESIYTYYADAERFAHRVESTNHFAREYMDAFNIKNLDLTDYYSGVNPYLKTRTPRVNNKQVILENIEFENLVVSRKLKTNVELRRSKILKEKAQDLFDKIESYLNEINN